MNSNRFSRSFLALAFCCAPALLYAEEGMWTFDNPPTKQLQEK
ncbi:MAG TPA: hypothetical protein VFW83_05580 [Bryobacteraceae bacterium]|nr:hypothetical protein [Bryobacteraceae bacterium]